MTTDQAASPQVVVRPATPDDVALILSLIRELAEFERALHEVHATEESLRSTLFADAPRRVLPHRGVRRAGCRLRAVVPQLLDLARRARSLPRGPLRPRAGPREGRRDRAAGRARAHLRGPGLPAAGVVGARLEPGARLLRVDRGERPDRVDPLPADRRGAATRWRPADGRTSRPTRVGLRSSGRSVRRSSACPRRTRRTEPLASLFAAYMATSAQCSRRSETTPGGPSAATVATPTLALT